MVLGLITGTVYFFFIIFPFPVQDETLRICTNATGSVLSWKLIFITFL
jgi:hypothetical protein